MKLNQNKIHMNVILADRKRRKRRKCHQIVHTIQYNMEYIKQRWHKIVTKESEAKGLLTQFKLSLLKKTNSASKDLQYEWIRENIDSYYIATQTNKRSNHRMNTLNLFKHNIMHKQTIFRQFTQTKLHKILPTNRKKSGKAMD
jgi:hypothetical protein